MHVRNARSTAVDTRIGGHDPPQFPSTLSGCYGHRLLPVCCPTGPTADLRDRIRIARLHHPSCMSRKAGDLRFL
jgi:hypothetical protein